MAIRITETNADATLVVGSSWSLLDLGLPICVGAITLAIILGVLVVLGTGGRILIMRKGLMISRQVPVST